jgi:hypothetical protein
MRRYRIEGARMITYDILPEVLFGSAIFLLILSLTLDAADS